MASLNIQIICLIFIEKVLVGNAILLTKIALSRINETKVSQRDLLNY